MADRVPCCIPFCKRTFKAEPGTEEVMCGKHYRLADQSARRRRSKIVRKYKIAEAKDDDETLYRTAILADRLWRRIKRQATERSVGI